MEGDYPDAGSFGSYLRRRLKQTGRSQAGFARAAGIDPNTLGKYLRAAEPPWRSFCEKLASALGESVEAFMAGFEAHRARTGADRGSGPELREVFTELPTEIAAMIEAYDAEQERGGAPRGSGSTRLITASVALLLGQDVRVRDCLLSWSERSVNVPGESTPVMASLVHRLAEANIELQRLRADIQAHEPREWFVDRVLDPSTLQASATADARPGPEAVATAPSRKGAHKSG